MPPICPMIQLLGSCFGQEGSTLNSGPSAIACDAVNANPKKNTDAASLERRDMAISPNLQWRIFSTSLSGSRADAAPAHISGLRRVDSNGVMPRASNYFAYARPYLH